MCCGCVNAITLPNNAHFIRVEDLCARIINTMFRRWLRGVPSGRDFAIRLRIPSYPYAATTVGVPHRYSITATAIPIVPSRIFLIARI